MGSSVWAGFNYLMRVAWATLPSAVSTYLHPTSPPPTHPPPLQFVLLPQYVRWHCSPTLTPYSCLIGEPPLQFVLLPRRRSPPPPVKRAEPERRDDRGRDKRPPSPIRRRSPPRRASPPRRRWGRGGAGDIVCQPADRVWLL